MTLRSNKPLISVILPVYNGEKFLRKAIDSILKQTYKNFELIIINDGSTDKSAAIIESISDSRIKVINNRNNLRLPRSLNIGISLAKGEYIARMDADDICLPERLEKQFNFLETNKDVGVCGTNISIIDENETILTDRVWGDNNPPIEWSLLWENPIAHSTVMIRTNIIKRDELFYREIYSEDSDLWCRLALKTRIKRINDVLLLYRYRADSEFNKNRRKHLEAALEVSENYAIRTLATKINRNYRELTAFYSALHKDKESYDYKDFKLQIELWDALRKKVNFTKEEEDAILYNIFLTIEKFHEQLLTINENHLQKLNAEIDRYQGVKDDLELTKANLEQVLTSRSYKIGNWIRNLYKLIFRQ